MDRKIKDKRITVKNYIIIAGLFIVTGSLIIILANYYKDYRQYYRSIPVINGYIIEISEDELDNYLLENNDTYIYIGRAEDNNSRKLEKDLKNIIKKYNLKDKTIYINLSKVRNQKEFIKYFNNKYMGLKEINTYPSFIIIRNKKILDLVSGNIEVNNIESLLKSYGMIGD